MKNGNKILIIGMIILSIICLNTISAQNNTEIEKEKINAQASTATENTLLTKESNNSRDTPGKSIKTECNTNKQETQKTLETNENNIQTKNTTKKESGKTLKTGDDTQTADVSSYDELNATIEEAKKSTKSNYIINLKEGDYNITGKISWSYITGNVQTLTINGNNIALDGNNEKPFLSISQNTTVILNNMTLVNMKNIVGGTINNNGDLTLNHVNIINSTCENDNSGGGAIKNRGNLKVNGCLFENNTSNRDGGAIYTDTGSYTDGIVYIDNTIFKNNQAISGSSIYSINQNYINIINSTFINNTAIDSVIFFNGVSNKTCISNCLISNNYALENLISNYEELSINNSTITNNCVNESIIFNNELCSINNTIIRNSTAKNLITNFNEASDYLTISDSAISDNNVQAHCINSTNSSLTITNTIFDNTANKDFPLINIDNSDTKIIASKFYNNTQTGLFAGNNFTTIRDNEYKANNLKNTTLNVASIVQNIKDPLNAIVRGTVSASPIYNTTISSGAIYVKYQNNTLNSTKVVNGTFSLNMAFKTPGNKEISIIYDGATDYVNKSSTNSTNIQLPEYALNLTAQESYKFNDAITYNIIVTNIGNIAGYGVKINDAVPSNLEYVNSSIEYQKSTNSLTIEYLDINKSNNIEITAKSTNITDILIKPSIINYPNNETVTVNHTIKYLKAEYELHVNMNGSNKFSGSSTCQISVHNKAEGIGTNVTVIYQLKQENKLLNEQKYTITQLDSNETKITEINVPITAYGTLESTIYVMDNANSTTNYTNEFNVSKPSIQIDDINAHYGDIINITVNIADIDAINKGNVTFKLNGKIINETIAFNNTSIQLLNYEIKENLQTHNTLKVIYSQKDPKLSISKTYKFDIKKLNVISYLSPKTIDGGDSLNITVKLTDENGNKITGGKVVFKINGVSLRDKKGNVVYIKVNNSQATLNYKLSDSLRKNKYRLDFVYSGSDKYYSNRNKTSLAINNVETQTTVENIRQTNSVLKFNIRVSTIKKNTTVNKGKIVVKINGKTIWSSQAGNSTTFTCNLTKNKKIKTMAVYYYKTDYYMASKNYVVSGGKSTLESIKI